MSAILRFDKHPTVRGNVVITGGKGALAQAIATEFSDARWSVEAPGRNELDVRSQTSVVSYFSNRKVDLLICAAGITRDEPLIRLSEAWWDEVLETNLDGATRCAKAVIEGMLRRKRGHIIMISSFSAIHPPKGQTAYAASKAGLIGLTKALATETGPFGIRVNVVLPGFLQTTMTGKLPESRVDEIRRDHVLGTFNTSDRVARFIRLLEEEMPHTSGQVFQLDSRVA